MMDNISIINQLFLLTEQYKRLNELLKNKQNMLQRKAIRLKKKRYQNQKQLHDLWASLVTATPEFSDNSVNGIRNNGETVRKISVS